MAQVSEQMEVGVGQQAASPTHNNVDETHNNADDRRQPTIMHQPVTNHFHISLDLTPSDDLNKYKYFFEMMAQAFGTQLGLSSSASAGGSSGTNRSHSTVSHQQDSGMNRVDNDQAQRPSSVHGSGPRRVKAQVDLFSSLDDDHTPRQRSNPRRVVEGFVRNQDAAEGRNIHDDSSPPEEPVRTRPRRSGASSLAALDDAPPGVCNKCRTNIPTVILCCMHLYCEPCITRMANKRRPCVRRNCKRAFRSWKSLHL